MLHLSKGSRTTQREIVVVGSEPPPIGGTTVLVQRMLRSFDMRGLPYAHIDPRIGVARLMLRLARLRPCGQVFMINVSTTQLTRVGPVTVTLRCLGHRVIWRFFGGAVDVRARCMSPWQKMTLRIGVALSSRIFVETKMLAQGLRAEFGGGRISWLPNTRPTVPREGRRFTGDVVRVCYLGRVCEDKGVLQLVSAVKRLKGRAVLDILGPVEADFESLLLAEVNNSKSVNILGSLDPESVSGVLQAYDCLFLPTRWHSEGYPGVVLEAFAAGVPVAASRWRALPELFQGREQLLFEAHEESDMLRVLRLFTDGCLDIESIISSQDQCLMGLSEGKWGKFLTRYLLQARR